MIEIPRDWFDYTSLGAGIVGLLFSIGAVIQATGAKVAAEKAESSILRQNAEGDFATLARMAKELHGFVQGNQMPEARLRTTDLIFELPTAVSRHSGRLGSRVGELKAKLLDLKLIAEGLNEGTETLSSSERVRLLGISGAILEELAGKSGELKSKVESEAANG